MSLIFPKLREISIFIYTFVILLIFNLFFNLNYTWPGISIIVRVYLFVFSWYLIYIFASLNIDEYKKVYTAKYKKRGNLILFIESRGIPFLIIYLTIVLFTLIDYVRAGDWPWNPFLSLLNGRYSNNIIYSLLLLVVLQLKKKPVVTILLWVSIFLIYGIADKVFYSFVENGWLVSAVKILKLLLIFFVIYYEFFKNIFKNLFYSILSSAVLYLIVFLIFAGLFTYSDKNVYQRKESGLNLIRMGYSFPFKNLEETAVKKKDYTLLENLITISNQYNIEIKYSNNEWEALLFGDDVNTADMISGYLVNKNIDLSYDKILDYVEKNARANKRIENAQNFIRISSKSFIGHDKELIDIIKNSNRIIKLWGIRVLGENKSIDSIPALLNFITDIDDTIAGSAYQALTEITGMNPASALDKEKNDPDVIEIFKKYYLRNRTSYLWDSPGIRAFSQNISIFRA